MVLPVAESISVDVLSGVYKLEHVVVQSELELKATSNTAGSGSRNFKLNPGTGMKPAMSEDDFKNAKPDDPSLKMQSNQPQKIIAHPPSQS